MVTDLNYALRMLAKTSGFTAIPVLILELGIGANRPIFSVIDKVLLRTLPSPKPGELVAVWGTSSGRSERETDSFPVLFVLGGAGLVASYLPECRATNVDPVVALRYE